MKVKVFISKVEIVDVDSVELENIYNDPENASEEDYEAAAKQITNAVGCPADESDPEILFNDSTYWYSVRHADDDIILLGG